MIFTETNLSGVYMIDLEPISDERGFFARTWCAREFALHGLNSNLVQCNLSFNARRGTLRGMHYQVPPHEEVKLVSCISGSIYDVIIDLRKDSPTFCQWQAVELSAQSRQMIYIPEGFAHGFQTLQDDTSVFYQMSECYHPECARGFRWDDQMFGINWPIGDKIVSDKDQKWMWLEEKLKMAKEGAVDN
jgi:dTDP-4-dehydrorhamnose 3,5-epimerase